MHEGGADLEGKDEDRLQHQEGHEIRDGAECRHGGRDDQIGQQQNGHRHDQGAVAGPQPLDADTAAPVGRLALGALAGEMAVLEDHRDVVAKPEQDGDGDRGVENDDLRLQPLEESEAESDAGDDQGDGEIHDDEEGRSRQKGAARTLPAWREDAHEGPAPLRLAGAAGAERPSVPTTSSSRTMRAPTTT